MLAQLARVIRFALVAASLASGTAVSAAPLPDEATLEALSQLSVEERAELMRRLQEAETDPADRAAPVDDVGAGASTRGRTAPRTSQRSLRMDPNLRYRDGESDEKPRAGDREFERSDEKDSTIEPRTRSKDVGKKKPPGRFELLPRPDQLAITKACADRKKERLVRSRLDAEDKARERGQAVSPPTNASAAELDNKIPARCTDNELEDYLALINPFSRFSERPEPFGYDLFDQAEDSFLGDAAMAVPSDYVLGPGDKVEVQLFGKENRRHLLTVTRDGVLQFPQLGPIDVAGMGFDDVRELIKASVAESMIGVQASVTMGPLRSIRVFVLGDVKRPGSYTIGAQSTVTNALFASGGIRETGSLRSVQVKRGGEVVTTLDLYDLLLRGDTGDDMLLDPGDVVFVPAVGKTVSISGEVVRPATYEIKGTASVEELIRLGGGLLPTAYAQNVALERIRGQTDRTIATLDLSGKAGRSTQLQSGDHLRVYSVFDRAENVVLLTGSFERPGLLQWTNGMRLSDAIPDLRSLRPGTDSNYVVIRREVGPERRLEMISGNPKLALADPSSPENLLLHSRDQIIVFPGEGKREDLLERVVEELRLQGGMTQEAQLVEIAGRVKAPGKIGRAHV